MLNVRNLIIDTMCEVYPLLRAWRSHEFWNLAQHDPIANSIYVIGRKQLVECQHKIREMAEDPAFLVIFCNSAEGSNTLVEQCDRVLKLGDLIRSGKILLISGGDMPMTWPCITYEHLLCSILDYQSNRIEMSRLPEIFEKKQKPYDFLFLNGRARPHRKYLLNRFQNLGLLDRSLWTFLDGRSSVSGPFDLPNAGMLSNTDIRSLPVDYEVSRYQHNKPMTVYANHFAKNDIFNNEWGEIYLRADAYIDTYFSVVTETVFEQPWSFRTEKIAKVLAQGHPWICASSPGWYRDLRDLGFRTFVHVIDESFDTIEDHQSRMDRIIDVVQDLCRSDLPAFLAECEQVCKYNQQHLREFMQQHRKEFPRRFFQFINTHG